MDTITEYSESIDVGGCEVLVSKDEDDHQVRLELAEYGKENGQDIQVTLSPMQVVNLIKHLSAALEVSAI